MPKPYLAKPRRSPIRHVDSPCVARTHAHDTSMYPPRQPSPTSLPRRMSMTQLMCVPDGDAHRHERLDGCERMAPVLHAQPMRMINWQPRHAHAQVYAQPQTVARAHRRMTCALDTGPRHARRLAYTCSVHPSCTLPCAYQTRIPIVCTQQPSARTHRSGAPRSLYKPLEAFKMPGRAPTPLQHAQTTHLEGPSERHMCLARIKEAPWLCYTTHLCPRQSQKALEGSRECLNNLVEVSKPLGKILERARECQARLETFHDGTFNDGQGSMMVQKHYSRSRSVQNVLD